MANTDIAYSEDIRSELPNFDIEKMDIFDKEYHRTFNNNSFENGGRYWGPWWQNAPKETRKFIRLNGNATVYLDFNAMNVHLCYSLNGESYQDRYGEEDPYMLDGYPVSKRAFLKTCMLLMLNSNSKNWCVVSIKNDLIKQNMDVDLSEIQDALLKLEDKHDPIEEFFYRMNYLVLQNAESRVSEAIITQLTERNIPALNIHDGYIVESHNEDIARELMVTGFELLSFSSIPLIKREF